jgi:very-short-patch-repair endonuclease
LRDEGWMVLRIWEHEASSEASKSVIELITAARSSLREVPATPRTKN